MLNKLSPDNKFDNQI